MLRISLQQIIQAAVLHASLQESISPHFKLIWKMNQFRGEQTSSLHQKDLSLTGKVMLTQLSSCDSKYKRRGKELQEVPATPAPHADLRPCHFQLSPLPLTSSKGQS